MAVSAVAAKLSAPVVRAGLQKATNLLMENIAARSARLLRKLKNAEEIAKLQTQLREIRKVKTIAQIDKAVDLTTFYCDSHVYIEDKRIKIQNLFDFGSTDNLIIEGIAGQGKSIFLRYLCSKEAAIGYFIPIFGELRKVRENETIEEYITETLKRFHIEAEGETLSDLLDSGNVVLFLDAFDEIREDSKLQVAADIEQLTLKHSKLRVIITSRPNSGIANCPTFRVVKLSNLENEDYEKVIGKISATNELANSLIRQVRQHKGGIKGLLQTPLLVTLLVIKFKSYQQLPEQLSDFYDDLFELLLQRHDGTKPGYRRQRACSINDIECRESFEAFCYFSKRIAEGQFKYLEAYELSKIALKDKNLNENAQNFLKDIEQITCLLVKDGEEYRFIHKSVQEYYAATYIKNKPEVVAKRFYAKMFEGDMSVRFNQELAFLEEIDSYRFFKFGALPYFRELFTATDDEFLESPESHHVDSVKRVILTIQIHGVDFKNKFYPQLFRIPSFSYYSRKAFDLIEDAIYRPFFNHRHTTVAVLKDLGNKPDEVWPLERAIDILPNKKSYHRKMIDAAVLLTNYLFEYARKGVVKVRADERLDHILNLDIDF